MLQTKLAENFGLSQPSVSQICKNVEKELIREMAAEMWRLKLRHFKRLENIYFECLEAYGTSPKTSADMPIMNQARAALDSIERVMGFKAPTQIDMSIGPPGSDDDPNNTITVESTLSLDQQRTAITSLLHCLDEPDPINEAGNNLRVERNGKAPYAHPPGANGLGNAMDNGAAS